KSWLRLGVESRRPAGYFCAGVCVVSSLEHWRVDFVQRERSRCGDRAFPILEAGTARVWRGSFQPFYWSRHAQSSLRPKLRRSAPVGGRRLQLASEFRVLARSISIPRSATRKRRKLTSLRNRPPRR